jgi:hypothetical protein
MLKGQANNLEALHIGSCFFYQVEVGDSILKVVISTKTLTNLAEARHHPCQKITNAYVHVVRFLF